MAKLSDFAPYVPPGHVVRYIAKGGEPIKVTKNKKDAQGHEHGNDGKFTGKGGDGSMRGCATCDSATKAHVDAQKKHLEAGYAGNDAAKADAGQKVKEAHGAMMAAHAQHDAESAAMRKPDAGKPDASVMKSPKDITEEHRGKDGKVDHDGATSQNIRRGHYKTRTKKRQAVFMIGGGGSGKSGIVEQYAGTEHGKTDKAGNLIVPGHEKYVPSAPGHEDQVVFDADREKKKNPIYSDQIGRHPSLAEDEDAKPEHVGMYGPSGPRTWEELGKYTPEEQQAVRDHAQAQLGMSLEDFATKHPAVVEENAANDAKKGEVTHFGAGLTHEISSAVSKANLQRALADKNHPSFVYDSIGTLDYKKWAAQAAAAGYQPIFHRVETPREIAHMRNHERERTIGDKAINGTHDKADKVDAALTAWGNDPSTEVDEAGVPKGGAQFGLNDEKGGYLRTAAWKPEQLDEARHKGYTAQGHSPELEATNKAKFHQEFSEKNGRPPEEHEYPYAKRKSA